MVLASDYPFMNILWTMIIFFAWVAWIWMLIVIFSDIFRRHDIGGWTKAAWVVFLIILPFLGVLIYLIAEHKGMADRQQQAMEASKRDTDTYIRTVAGGSAAEIEQAKGLLDAGTITQAEYDTLKAKALAA